MLVAGRHLPLLAFLAIGAQARAQVAPKVDAVPSLQSTLEVDEITSAYLVIRLQPDLALLPERQVVWDRACIAIGKSMQTGGTGPWGLGPFATFTCKEPTKKFGAGVNDSLWRLTVSLVGKDGELSMRLAHEGFEDDAIAVNLGRSIDPLELLQHPELTRRIAAVLTDAMPMMTRFKRIKATKGKVANWILKYPVITDVDLEDAGSVPPPPQTLNLYGLRWDKKSKLWRPRIVGAARLTNVVLPKVGKNAAGRATYEIEPAAAAALTKSALWAHDGRGSGANQVAWSQALDAAYAASAEAQEDRLSSPLVASAADVLGFVGLRYGKQILTGNKLLERTSFFGLLLEVRAGPLSGLQYFYDVLPPTILQETSVKDLAVQSSLSWTRHVLGYTFRLPFPFLLDSVTLTPKVGIWNLHARIPGAADALGRIDELRAFDISKALSVGAEFGGEILVSRAAIRPWGGLDAGFSPLGDKKRVTSRRVGLDLYVAGPRLAFLGATVRFAALGFLFVENVSLTSDDENRAEAVENADGVKRTVARRIEYSAGYAGLGLALSW